MIIGELVARHPPSVRPEQPLFDAIALMFDHHAGHLPVVDDTGKVVGMLSEGDVRRTLGDPARYLASTRERHYDVQDVMDTGVPAIPCDRPIAELAHYFADPRLDALPIVDHAGALVGVVSYIDALHALGGSP